MPNENTESAVTVYTTVFCPYCQGAKRLLDEKDIEYESVDLTGRDDFREFLVDLTGQRTVPQILIHGQPIGGFTELRALEQSGALDKMIETGTETVSTEG
ncbi:MAG: glutathione S-transferase N-terminal domain-containing protein [Candidatus Marinimicrobia bacterium]|nr:glutathione S-transferase N-terminal domain-containing protein [Candidatus Neomarinimicrobiota bacterium]MCF7829208.1 glutathione S-transferase N-terminal domain-containing protein [Candidatus Neomarinimicrobiota bacterium]MCF7881139.1 glutathione S-transferase N-terminal domain-containing protein [Candidatus Neomarinimicrobiota bacterium]